MKNLTATIALSAALLVLPVTANAQETSDRSEPFVLEPLASSQNIDATIAYGENENTRRVALEGWRLFQEAWATGAWDEFMAITTDEFEFFFPNPPYAGVHRGDEGRAMLERFAADNKQAGYLIRGVTFATTIAGNRALFEVQSEGIEGDDYRNIEAIVLEVEGDKISALREYWLVLDPSNTQIARD